VTGFHGSELVARQLAQPVRRPRGSCPAAGRVDRRRARAAPARTSPRVRVAGALAHAVDVAWTYAAPCAHAATAPRGWRRRVRWAVEVDRLVDELDRRATSSATASGEADAERVDDDEPPSLPASTRGRVHALVDRSRARTGGVRTPKNAAWMPCLGGEAHRPMVMRSSIFSRETPIASSFWSEIGDSITDARTPSRRAPPGRSGTAREKPRSRPQARAETSSTAASRRRDAREPASIRSIRSSSRARDLELVVGEARRRRSARRRAGSCRRGRRAPDAVGSFRPPVQIRSAHDHSVREGRELLGAAAVTRELSSTRRPPPPSQ
jgi:hypothetical protein